MLITRKKTISIATPTCNEAGNVNVVYQAVKDIFDKLPQYRYEHIFADNGSTDGTIGILRQLASEDKNVKVILNTRNFGPERSGHNLVYNCYGDAVIILLANLKEPPDLIPEFIKKWEEGYKIVIGIKEKSDENKLMFLIRKAFYYFIRKFSDEGDLIDNFIGFGLYDKIVIDKFREIKDPYLYFRGFISDTGFERSEFKYHQKKRVWGRSKNKFINLYDTAISGLVQHSRALLRMASLIGFSTGFLCFIISLVYLVYKLLFWSNFTVGIAPLVIGIFFFFSLLLIFIGLLGEYINAILLRVKNYPAVYEQERINFEKNEN